MRRDEQQPIAAAVEGWHHWAHTDESDRHMMVVEVEADADVAAVAADGSPFGTDVDEDRKWSSGWAVAAAAAAVLSSRLELAD